MALFPYCLQETKLSEIMLARIVTRFSAATGLDFYVAFFTILYGPALLCLIALRWVAPRTKEAPNKAAMDNP